MNLLSFASAALLALPLGWNPLLSAAEPLSPSWAFRISMQDGKGPLSQELLEKIKPLLGEILADGGFVKHLAWLKVQGLTDPAHPEQLEFVVHLHLQDDASTLEILRQASENGGGTWDTIDGLSVLKLPAPWKIDSSDSAYVAVPAERHLVICSGRLAAETLALSAPDSWLGGGKAGEVLSADFDFSVLKGLDIKSELLSMLGGRMSLNLNLADDHVDLQALAELADDRTAKRARRMLEGLVAALSAQLPPDQAGPLDDRLELTSEGKTLHAKLNLTNAELEKWLQSIETDMQVEMRNTSTIRHHRK